MLKGVFGVRGFVVALLSALLLGGGGTAIALACGDAPSEPSTLASTMPQVRYGQSGADVLALQLALKERKGYPLNGTGYYGDKTLAAVKAFQRKNGIRSSGIVGSKTWHALLGSLPAHAYGPEVPTYGIQLGECNRAKIAALYDRMLRIYPYYMPNESPGVGNCYTSQRQALVKDFQRRAGINPSGIVGPKTWNALHKVVSASTGWTG
jgi:peptidoglycan hydrolase-like protein with peptidoglycan-binding domain